MAKKAVDKDHLMELSGDKAKGAEMRKPITDPARARGRAKREISPHRPGVKERLTVHLPIDVIARLKDAVYWTPGLTLAGLAESALSKAVDKLEKQRGEPFPPREAELTGGRPSGRHLEPGLLGIIEVAEILKLSKHTVYGIIREGKLPHIRPVSGAIRVRESDLKKFIESRGERPRRDRKTKVQTGTL